jgi:hypothetical protein
MKLKIKVSDEFTNIGDFKVMSTKDFDVVMKNLRKKLS